MKSIQCPREKPGYLDFEDKGPTVSGKTRRYTVRSKATDIAPSMILGSIHWYSLWRKYIFIPNWDTVFDHLCLEEIVDFLHKIQTERTRPAAKLAEAD